MFKNEHKVIGIIGAMDAEVNMIKERVENPQIVTISGIDFVYGEWNGLNIVVARCGIGKVFAAICAQTLILTFHPDVVINVGVGGSLTPELDIADVAIGVSAVQHDMDTTPLGDPLGLISGINIVYLPCDEKVVEEIASCAEENGIHYKKGVITSGDRFVNSSELKKSLVENFQGIVCEMEGAAIAHVCYVNQVPCCVVRSISDNGDENSHNDYSVSLAKASAAAIRLLSTYLDHCARA